MIEVQQLNQQKECFESYDELFDSIVEKENQKMVERYPDFQKMQWSFTGYSPHQVGTFPAHLKDQHSAIKEASESQLPLIEICTGDYTNPEYVVATENFNIGRLKKKWVLAYCAAHNLTIHG